MANVRLAYPNDCDEAILAAVPAFHASLPPTNWQDQTRGRVGRSTVTSNQVVWGNFTALRTIAMCALGRHNLTSVGTAQLKLWAGLNRTGTLVYNSTALPIGSGSITPWGQQPWGRFPWGAPRSTFPAPSWAIWFTPVGMLSFELTLNDPANPKSYLQASRLVLGNYFEPTTNMAYGAALAWKETSKLTRTEGGSLRTEASSPYRRWSLSLDALSEVERAAFLAILQEAGMRDDIFLSCFVGVGGNKERDYQGMVKLVEMPDLAHPNFSEFSASVVFEEA